MTKNDLINEIYRQSMVGKDDVKKVVEAFMNNVKVSLSDGKNVYLRGFGSFTVKKRARKPARNIKTGEQIIVPARSVPHFKPSPEFKKVVIN